MAPSTKTAIITGASGGIGRAIALRLAADGFATVVGYADAAEKAAAVVEAIRGIGGQGIATQADVADPAAVTRLFTAARGQFGGIAVVANSAGAMNLAPIEAGDVALFDRMITTNLLGAFLVMGEAARQLGEGGRIIMLSSSVIARAFPGYGAYIAAKAGVEGLVRVLANELRGRGITVNAVAPGPVATDLFLTGKAEAQVAQLSKAAPLERLGYPEAIAVAVAFLTGSKGGWVNAQALRANRGFA